MLITPDTVCHAGLQLTKEEEEEEEEFRKIVKTPVTISSPKRCKMNI